MAGGDAFPYGETAAHAKKLRGALAAELLRLELNRFAEEYALPVLASNGNVYIAGSKYEYDLLPVKAEAQPVCGLIYRPEDVVAVIESKAGGLFSLEDETHNIARAVNRAWQLNPSIRFGDIAMSENVPKNTHKANGAQTVNHWTLTQQYLSELVSPPGMIYAVTLHQGKELIDTGSDAELEEFFRWLMTGETEKTEA